MNDETKNTILKVVGCLLLFYCVLTARVIWIGPTEGHNSRIVLGTNFWRFYPLDSVAAYCERNAGSDKSIGFECNSQISQKVVDDKWLITLSEAEPPKPF
ncbi:hypothetical protein [Agrobacterium tumefaciens]|uniref:hypothetical protein n=1 Tax=Agrobacterium tumefaciens TaxID=358 RepID=UPI000DD3FB1C|nr:hypothetical protein [Agrobacterium tumefaciens]NTA17106.1 hypothetical protein [Agrobacterium tumefaciens]WCK72435.1 hypothetical protein G6L96_014630 [Agrobacterium tumefaciens]